MASRGGPRPIIRPPAATCQEPCKTCSEHFWSVENQKKHRECRYVGVASDEQAESAVRQILENINQDRQYLCETLQTHGDLILSRWSKKSKEKRAVFLCNTSPEVFGDGLGQASTHSDDTQREQELRRDFPRWMRDFDSPALIGNSWLNLADFADDRMRLPSTLHFRTQYDSSAWAACDMKFSSEAFRHGRLALPFYEKCVWMCGDSYGKIVDWDEKWTLKFSQVGFPRAMMTFYLQKKIMNVLRSLVDAIVNGAEGTGNVKWKLLEQSGFRASGSEALWSSYTNPAFAPPGRFDPRRMLWKAKARLNLVLDEIEFMQTDPAYMHHVLRERKAGPRYDTLGLEMRWMHIGSTLAIEMISRVCGWHLVVERLEEFCEVFQRHEANLRIGHQLPDALNDALYKLGACLKFRVGQLSHIFDGLLPSMRPMKDIFSLHKFEKGLEVRERLDMDPNDNMHRLKFIVDRMQEVATADIPSGLSQHFSGLEIDLLCQGHGKLVDKRLYDRLSDIMTADDLFSDLKWCQLSYIPGRNGDKMTVAQMNADNPPGTAVFDMTTCERIGRLSKKFNETAWPQGRKDLAWLEKATQCRQQLSRLWQCIREEAIRAEDEAKQSKKGLFRFVDNVVFDKRPVFLAELEREREACEKESAALAAAALMKQQHLLAAEPQTVWGSSNDSAPVRRKQTKAKANKLSSGNGDVEATLGALKLDETALNDENNEKPREQSISVKQDSLSFFHKMFPSNGEVRSSVRWTVFTQAMGDAGFVATEAGGSAVSFNNGAGSIVFHKPHPDPMVDPIMLQVMGKRMRKWFGWCNEKFVLRDREAVEEQDGA